MINKKWDSPFGLITFFTQVTIYNGGYFMRKDYFKGVLGSLHADRSGKMLTQDFVTLKSYEYWIRMMRVCKSYPDADDCIAIFPKERASRVLKDAYLDE